MGEVVLPVPILPGKRAAFEEVCKAMSGPRRAEAAQALKSHGTTKESWFLESGPGGDRCIVYYESGDPMGALQRFASSKQPFDLWLKERIKEVTGIDFNHPPSIELPRQLYREGY